MNKIILTSIIIVGSMVSSYSQSGQKWATGGNSNVTGDFLGTTNNFPLDFKTNNVLRMSLGTNGVLKINNLAGIGNRLLQVDASGNLIQLPQGASNQYLSGTGTWVNIPNISNLWQSNGNSLFYNNGYVGIGTNTPLFPLDVVGDARITNNLYVGGGVVISDKVKATTEVKGWDIKVDNDLSVESATRLKGSTRIDQGFTFDGTNGITMSQATPNSQRIFSYGAQVNGVLSNCAAGPAQQTWGAHHFGGLLQIYDADPLTGVYNPNSGLLNFQTWGGGSSIDASIGGQTSSGTALLLNYFCGNDVAICTGANGGRVSMGKKVEIGGPYPPNQNIALNIKSETDFTGIDLKTNHSGDYGYNTILTVNRDKTKAIGIYKSTGAASTENFVVFGDGSTNINTNETDAFTVTSKTSNTINFKVKNTGYVYAREMNIMIGTFPDYVFNNDYKLMPLLEVEKYIQSNNHLKGFEKASVYEKDGMPIGEVVRLQQEKIEELTLYLIELKKEINNLKNAK